MILCWNPLFLLVIKRLERRKNIHLFHGMSIMQKLIKIHLKTLESQVKIRLMRTNEKPGFIKMKIFSLIQNSLDLKRRYLEKESILQYFHEQIKISQQPSSMICMVEIDKNKKKLKKNLLFPLKVLFLYLFNQTSLTFHLHSASK